MDEHRPGAWARTPTRLPVLLLLVLLPLCAACSHASPQTPAASPHQSRRAAAQVLLDRRAEAVRNHNRSAFMRTVARRDPAFVREQRRYFDNLVQLPLQRFGYRVLAHQWPHRLAKPSWGKHVTLPRVRLTTQLRGFDSAPVRRTTGLAIAPWHGGLRVVSDRTRTGAVFPGSEPAPWDLAAIEVRSTRRVLGLFDRRTVTDADTVLEVADKGIHEVSRAVPFRWPGRAVVYYFKKASVLDAFDNVPGGNIRHLGAMSFPVRTAGPGSEPTSMRITLLPSSLAAGQPFLGRIVRHELTHVALGERDDGAPVWFAEGIAEYVGARPLPRSQRRIASIALTRARAGVDAMPASDGFNGTDQDWHYALSWMACDYIASTRGESRLWALMRAFHHHASAGSGVDNRQDAVLRRVLGYDSHELARRAAHRILEIYG